MAERIKILAQSIAAINGGSHEIYQCPTGQLARIESIFVCNLTSSARVFYISVDKGGDNPDAPEDKDYLYYHASVGAYETVVITGPILLESQDRMEGYADDVSVVFNVYGTEY